MHAQAPKGGEQAPRPEPKKTFLDVFPTTEAWMALQGGRPRVFRNPNSKTKPWMVVHVYEDQGQHEKRFKSGAIVATMPRAELLLLRKGVQYRDADGNLVERDIVVPSFMDRNVHGDVCSVRSLLSGGDDYDRVRNQPMYERLLDNLRSDGWQELRFGVNQEGFTLLPLPEIRPSKPLEAA